MEGSKLAVRVEYIEHVLLTNQENKILTVYVSDKSMAAKKEEVILFTETKNKNLGDSEQKIELAA